MLTNRFCPHILSRRKRVLLEWKISYQDTETCQYSDTIFKKGSLKLKSLLKSYIELATILQT